MTADFDPSRRGLSTDVLGRFTPQQKGELTILAHRIVEAKGLKVDNPDDVGLVQAVVLDSLARGLRLSGRQALIPADSVPAFFERGLRERQGLLNQAKLQERIAQDYLCAPSLESLISVTDALSPDFEAAMQESAAQSGRIQTVQSLHERLFNTDDAGLLAQAKQVRAQDLLPGFGSLIVDPSQPDTLVRAPLAANHKLFANLLLNIANSNRLGMKLEPDEMLQASPEDIRFFIETGGPGREAELIAAVRPLARQLQLSEEDAAFYTQSVLNEMNLLAITQVTLDTIKAANVFLLTSQTPSQRAEAKPTGNQVVVLDSDDLAQARAKNELLNSLAERWQELLRQEPEAASGPAQESINRTIEEIHALMRGFRPIEIVNFLTTYPDRFDPSVDDSFSFFSLENTVQALRIVQADFVIEGESDKSSVAGFTPHERRLAQRELSEQLTEILLDQHVSLTAEQVNLITSSLPYESISRIVLGSDFKSLPIDLQQALALLPEEKIVRLLLAADTRVDPDGSFNSTTNSSINELFAALSPQRQTALRAQVTGEISFG